MQNLAFFKDMTTITPPVGGAFKAKIKTTPALYAQSEGSGPI